MKLIPFKIPNFQKRVSVQIILLWMLFFSTPIFAQSIKPKVLGRQIPKHYTDITGRKVDFDVPPEFPGGYEALQRFLNKNLKHKQSVVNVPVFIQFIVNIDGTLSDYKILRRGNKANDIEAVRVLKLSPKWKPATLKNKPVVVTFAIPVNFANK